MDYRKFLGSSQRQVLPYFGGEIVEGRDRRLRVVNPGEKHGWYEFSIKGRDATCVGPAERPDLSELPVVRGHLFGKRLVREGAIAETLMFMPDEEPPRLSPCRGRRWPSKVLLFEELEFETEAEPACRQALQESTSLANVKAAPATLRAAFALNVIAEASQRLGIPAAPAEVRHHLGMVADGGSVAAEQALRDLQAERVQAEREWRELQLRQEARLVAEQLHAARELRKARVELTKEDAALRARMALDGANAHLLEHRMLEGGVMEVIFRFMDERVVSLVQVETLQVIDSGICLGHPPSDKLLTLDSLPSVIREAIDTDSLVILRHA